MSRCSVLGVDLHPRWRGRHSDRTRLSSTDGLLDAALADYRDSTYATWTAPDGPTEVSPLTDRRIFAELRAAPKPQLPGKRIRYAVVAVGAAAACTAAIAVALSTVGTPGPVEPSTDVFLAAATPGGDRGPFADSSALQRCLTVARVPERQRVLLGAGPIQVRGTDATALLLPGPSLGDLTVLAVTPACADGGVASVLVTRTLLAPGRSASPSAGTP